MFVTSTGSPMFATTLTNNYVHVSMNYGVDWLPLNNGPAMLGVSSTAKVLASANRTNDHFDDPVDLVVSRNMGGTWSTVIPATAGYVLLPRH